MLSSYLEEERPGAVGTLAMTRGESGSPAGQSIQLSRLRGSPVILAFYLGSWNPVCADQLALQNGLG